MEPEQLGLKIHTMLFNAVRGQRCEVPNCKHTPSTPGEVLCDEHLTEVDQAYYEYEEGKYTGTKDHDARD